MKFLSYATTVNKTTAYVFGGKALDFDLEGGLEEILNSLINSGVRRIVLTLRGMKFLHYTLFACLLAVQRRLEEQGGDIILAETPWFVQNTLEELGLLHRFCLVPDAHTVERAEMMTLNLDRDILPG